MISSNKALIYVLKMLYLSRAECTCQPKGMEGVQVSFYGDAFNSKRSNEGGASHLGLFGGRRDLAY
jgi:hypothetical protein